MRQQPTSNPSLSFSFQKQKCVTFLSQNSSGFTTHTSDTSAGITFWKTISSVRLQQYERSSRATLTTYLAFSTYFCTLGLQKPGFGLSLQWAACPAATAEMITSDHHLDLVFKYLYLQHEHHGLHSVPLRLPSIHNDGETPGLALLTARQSGWIRIWWAAATEGRTLNKNWFSTCSRWIRPLWSVKVRFTHQAGCRFHLGMPSR